MHSILNSGLPIDNIWVFPVGPFFFTFGSPHIFRAVVRNLAFHTCFSTLVKVKNSIHHIKQMSL